MSKHNKRPDPTTPEAMAAYEAEMRAAEKKQLEALVGGNQKGFEVWRLGLGMSEYKQEAIDEFWHQPKGSGTILAYRAGTVSTGFVKVEPPLTIDEAERALRDADRRQRECDARYAANAAGCNTLSPHRALGGESWKRAAAEPPRGIYIYASSVEFGVDPHDPGGALLLCHSSPECGHTHSVYVVGTMVRNIHNRLATSRLADECGALKTENTALLAENARLRRRIEDMERKGKKR